MKIARNNTAPRAISRKTIHQEARRYSQPPLAEHPRRPPRGKRKPMTNSYDAQQSDNNIKIIIIAILISAISLMHLFFSHDFEKSHVIARELYFLPIILSAFWFGLRGAVITALSITVFYLTYSLFHWRGFSARDLDRLMEIVLFNIVALVVGFLQDRQRARAREKLESVKALAATVAHEMNSPLFVVMGTLELLQDDFDKESEYFQEIDTVMTNLKRLKVLIKKISRLEELVTKDYDGVSRIVDIEKSSTKLRTP